MFRIFTIGMMAIVALASAANSQAQNPGGSGNRGGASFSIVPFLQDPAVQKEIEFEAIQVEMLQKLLAENQDAWIKEGEKMGDAAKLTQELRWKFMQSKDKLRAETEKKVEGILLPRQLERVKQIGLQQQLHVLPRLAFKSPEVVKGLAFTDEQKAKIIILESEYATKAKEEMRSGEEPNSAPLIAKSEKIEINREKVEKARKEKENKFMEILTAEQKEKLEKMKGPKFDLSKLHHPPRGPAVNNPGDNR